jgi:hypothetical protein
MKILWRSEVHSSTLITDAYENFSRKLSSMQKRGKQKVDTSKSSTSLTYPFEWSEQSENDPLKYIDRTFSQVGNER